MENRLRKEFPQDYLTDEVIQQEKREALARMKDHPEFLELNQKRATAYRNQQRYLQHQSETLRELLEKVDAARLIP